jgi:hypothetical protein
VLVLLGELLAVLPLHDEHDASGIVDEHGVNALVARAAADRRNGSLLVLSDGSDKEEQNEELIIRECRIAVAEIPKLTTKVLLREMGSTHGTSIFGSLCVV